MFDQSQKICIYMEGNLDSDAGKMGFGLLRFSPFPIVCIIDTKFAGKTVEEAIGLPHKTPVVASVDAAMEFKPEIMVLGIAPSGGKFPDAWFMPVESALKKGLSIINGLHDDLNDKFKHLLQNNKIWDVRKPKESYPIASGKAAQLSNIRILMIGTDMASGKMTAGLELYKELLHQNKSVGFVATGQIGITIMGVGIPLDAIKVDQAAGAVEEAVLAHSDKDIVIIEGQGSLLHPGSTATLPLMRGAQPTHFVLCHKAANTHLRHPASHIKIPDLTEFIKLNEAVASVCGALNSASTIGIALNTSGLSDQKAIEQIEQIQIKTKLPVTDIIRYGINDLLNFITVL